MDYYDMNSWKSLVLKANQLGWYGGLHDLITLTIEGGFEHNLRSRATESWGTVYVIRTSEVKNSSDTVIWPAIEVKAESLEEASRKALSLLTI